MSTVIAFPLPASGVVYAGFGLCPVCRNRSRIVNVRRDHWGLCDTHRIKWLVGSNLFSGWQDEPPEEWMRTATAIAGYELHRPNVAGVRHE